MKEAENQHRSLEEKLLEAEKVKNDLEEQNRRAQASLEEQVFVTPRNLGVYIHIEHNRCLYVIFVHFS